MPLSIIRACRAVGMSCGGQVSPAVVRRGTGTNCHSTLRGMRSSGWADHGRQGIMAIATTPTAPPGARRQYPAACCREPRVARCYRPANGRPHPDWIQSTGIVSDYATGTNEIVICGVLRSREWPGSRRQRQQPSAGPADYANDLFQNLAKNKTDPLRVPARVAILACGRYDR